MPGGFCKAWTYDVVERDEATISLPNPLGLLCDPIEESYKTVFTLDCLILVILVVVPFTYFLHAKPCEGVVGSLLKRCPFVIRRHIVEVQTD